MRGDCHSGSCPLVTTALLSCSRGCSSATDSVSCCCPQAATGSPLAAALTQRGPPAIPAPRAKGHGAVEPASALNLPLPPSFLSFLSLPSWPSVSPQAEAARAEPTQQMWRLSQWQRGERPAEHSACPPMSAEADSQKQNGRHGGTTGCFTPRASQSTRQDPHVGSCGQFLPKNFESS